MELEFDVTIIPYTGSDTWIEKTLEQNQNDALDPRIPSASRECEYCTYIKTVNDTVRSTLTKDTPKKLP